MGQLEDLETFVRIAEAGGIGNAAAQTGLAKSVISRRLARLEARLGTRLLARTTRSWSLTEAGNRCYEQALRLLDANAELTASANPAGQQLEGRLRIAAPLSLGVRHLPPLLAEMGQRWPRLQLELSLADHYINLVESGIEVALRIGEQVDPSLRARRLSSVGLCLTASPNYLRLAGEPTRPEQLPSHRLLHYSGAGLNELLMTAPDGQEQRLRWPAWLQSNNGDLLNSLSVQGQGIACTPRFICWRDLAEGRLVQLLPEYRLPMRHLYAVYPAGRFVPQKVRAFIDFIVDALGDIPYWESG